VWIVVCAAGGLLAGCGGQARSQTAPAPPNPELKQAPPTPIAVEKVELGGDDPWNPDWDRMIEQALPPDLLSSKREREVKSLCPRFKEMSDADKRAFWAYFFQALAGAEAGLQPTVDVRHSNPEVAVIDPVTRRVARQQGLLQLAYMDSERYGCDFDWDQDKQLPEHDPAKTILQPKNNLLCGINILGNQLLTQHKPLLSKSSYWVTLRPGTYSYRLFIKQMANEPEACGPTPIRHWWRIRRRHRALSEAANQPPAAGSPPAAPSQAPAAGATAVSASRPAAAAH
jgi:hypothetical protein